MANEGSNDFFEETITQSWSERIIESLKGLIFGTILLFISSGILYWNEGRAVRTFEGLIEGSSAVKTVDANHVDPKYEGRLIHISGNTQTSNPVTDPLFKISVNGLLLARKSQILQWQEHESSSSTSNGSASSKETKKTYTYSMAWSDRLISSSLFKHPEGHSNPVSLKFSAETFPNHLAKLGNFEVPKSLISKLESPQSLPISDVTFQEIDPAIRNGLKLFNGGLYAGTNPASPQIGDISISFFQQPNGPVSIIGRQVGKTVEAYPTKSGTDLFLIREGIQSSQVIFKDEQNSNSNWTWGFRGGGFALMVFAFYLLMRPLIIVASYFPILGEILSVGGFVFALSISGVVSCLIIGFGWLTHRPLLGGALLISAAAISYYIYTKKQHRLPTPRAMKKAS